MTQHEAEEIVIQLPEIRVTAKNWGNADGIPVLGLHGWLDNANTFDRLAPLLPQINLVSLDLPGHGLSDHRPAGVRYHYTDFVDDVFAAADALGWTNFTLLGHSMGSGIGCLAAAAFPDRISQLMLIEGIGAVTTNVDTLPELLRNSVLAMVPQQSKSSAAHKNKEALIRARVHAGKISRESVEILMQRGIQSNGEGFDWRSDQRLKRSFPQYFTNEVMLAFLRSIVAPVLLITAEDGILKKKDYYPSRLKAVKNMHLVNLPGHHHLHLDNPASVAEAINDFLLNVSNLISRGPAA